MAKKYKDETLRDWLVILNPMAQDGLRHNLAQEISQELEGNGYDFELQVTQSKRHATELTQKGLKRGYTQVMSVGGGGLLNEVINGIMKQSYQPTENVDLVHIPVGTINDWAIHHHVPRDYKQWIPMIQEARPSLHDVGLITYEYGGMTHQWYFIGLASAGIGALVVKTMNENHYNTYSTRWVVIARLLKIVLKLPRTLLKLSYENQEKIIKLGHISIANCRYQGGFLITDMAVSDNGKLAIVHEKYEVSYFEWIKSFLKIFNNTLVKDKKTLFTETTKIRVEPMDDKPTYIQADGEFLGTAPFECVIVPRGIRIRLPKK